MSLIAVIHQRALGWLRSALYLAILAVVALRDAWLAGRQRAREAAGTLAAQHPWCAATVRMVLGGTGGGTSPRRPTCLGVVLAQPLQDSSAGSDLGPLATLIDW